MFQQITHKYTRITAATLVALLLSSCATLLPDDKREVKVVKPSSLMTTYNEDELNNRESDNIEEAHQELSVEKITSLARKTTGSAEPLDERYFSNKEKFKVAFDQLTIADFIHQVFANTLKANYVIEQKLNKSKATITLNINKALGAKALYKASKLLLAENGVNVSLKDDVFYVHSINPKKSGLVVQVGRTIKSVPHTKSAILQIIPLKYGVNLSIERTLLQLVKAKVSADADQSAVFVEGNREQVIQVIELIELLDRPAHQGKHIGFIEFNFITTEDFITTVNQLLENEGIPTGARVKSQRNLAMISLDQIGAVAVFASEIEFLNRVEFWAKKLDQAPKGDTLQYFIYRPKFARAEDIGASLMPLFGGQSNNNSAGNNNRDTKSSVANKTQNTATSSVKTRGLDNKDINIVVDKRANFVIVHASGSTYKNILPLIKSLDVMPKQILLEVTIAEVTLRDEFEYGVEFFLESGKFSLNTKGVFNVADISGALLNVAGSVSNVQAKAIERNSLVDVLSNPTLLVRDGATASIVVGDEIPLVTSTDTNDNTDVVRENIERRQTGLTLNVAPTINTNGVVILKIEQSISNQIAGNNQGILNRDLSTEAVANSGQTILLGGLISENTYDIDKSIPVLGDIPLLGAFFSSTTQSSEKTELVILVTPRVIYNTNQWDGIKDNFKAGLEQLSF
ncbi:MAG: secretin N-terminal domain-containing protein [Thalassotalea sp.]